MGFQKGVKPFFRKARIYYPDGGEVAGDEPLKVICIGVGNNEQLGSVGVLGAFDLD